MHVICHFLSNSGHVHDIVNTMAHDAGWTAHDHVHDLYLSALGWKLGSLATAVVD